MREIVVWLALVFVVIAAYGFMGGLTLWLARKVTKDDSVDSETARFLACIFWPAGLPMIGAIFFGRWLDKPKPVPPKPDYMPPPVTSGGYRRDGEDRP